jgi:hypothetical protein
LPQAQWPHYIGTRWRHRKGGEYEVLCIALLEIDLSPHVVYKSLATGVAYIRPLAEFSDGRFVSLPAS